MRGVVARRKLGETAQEVKSTRTVSTLYGVCWAPRPEGNQSRHSGPLRVIGRHGKTQAMHIAKTETIYQDHEVIERVAAVAPGVKQDI